MPRSWFDFGSMESLLGARQPDQAEIFHILAGVGLLDGLGRTEYFDTFKFGLGGWYLGSSGTGKAPKIQFSDITTPSEVFVPPIAIQFYTGNVANDFSYMSIDRAFTIKQKVGLEFGFILDNMPPTLEVYINVDFGAAFRKRAHLMLDATVPALKIHTDLGSKVITNITIPNPSTWRRYKIKTVINLDTATYERLLYNDAIYQLAGDKLAGGFAVGDNTLTLQFKATNKTGTPSYFTLGYVRFTVDEP